MHERGSELDVPGVQRQSPILIVSRGGKIGSEARRTQPAFDPWTCGYRGPRERQSRRSSRQHILRADRLHSLTESPSGPLTSVKSLGLRLFRGK